jgi:hypothetical protein
MIHICTHQESHSVMQISDAERLEPAQALRFLSLVASTRLGARSGHGQRADVRNDDQSADKVAPGTDVTILKYFRRKKIKRMKWLKLLIVSTRIGS